MKRTKLLILRFTALFFALFICAFAILYSSDNAEKTGTKSRSLTDSLAPALISDYENMSEKLQEGWKNGLESKLRKMAHAVEYLALGVSATVFAQTFAPAFASGAGETVNEDKKKRRFRPSSGVLLVLALLFCLAFAASDEIHQTFVPGRQGSVNDVLLDFIAALVGALIVRGVAEVIAAHKTKKK